MRALIPILLTLLLLPGVALAGEGDPLLSVDDLHTLEASYEAFLDQLGDLIIDRGLLSPEERSAWHDAQLGDFYQNGGYGSILASYMPGLLGFVREEDTLLTLSAQLPCGTLTLSTVRRYTPQDSSLSGLMLTLGLTDEGGLPLDVTWQLSATGGLFLKWDPVMGSYGSVGAGASSAGETVCWSDQTPAMDAQNPVITIDVLSAETGEAIGQAKLTLTVDGDGYLLTDDALSAGSINRVEGGCQPSPLSLHRTYRSGIRRYIVTRNSSVSQVISKRIDQTRSVLFFIGDSKDFGA